jgi:para-nitrobenzyl esterase
MGMSEGRRWWISLAALGVFAANSWAAPVQVENGAIEGAAEGALTLYLGVPLAAAPNGALRWRPPQPPAHWQGVRPATSFAPACMQKGVSMPGEVPTPTSEDCLYLNIWTPARAAKDRLPVMVWIHGGGYTNGSASMPLYWGDRLALRGVVVVTIAYRLGPLGFRAHPELTADAANQTSGYYGLLDQIAALEWIQRNIAAFGGDPRRVTIAGQSAGSMAVSMLMASPRAAGCSSRCSSRRDTCWRMPNATASNT